MDKRASQKWNAAHTISVFHVVDEISYYFHLYVCFALYNLHFMTS